MTMPDERSRSIRWAREFLRDLLNPRVTPGVPRAIRQRAYSVLKHYPADYHVNYAADGAPDHFDHLEYEDEWPAQTPAKKSKKTKAKKSKSKKRK